MTTQRHVQVAKTKLLFDELIDRHAEAYLEAYSGEVREFNSFKKSGTSGYYIGMVWTPDFEKPDVNQLKIMGSKAIADNASVEVDVKTIDSIQSFFPGQIIAFLAEPFTKSQLVARRMLDPMRIAPPMKSINTDKKINLMIACGPYMKGDQEDWTLYDQIIASVKENQVTHLVLIGPFVDIDNKFARANFDAHWKRIFDKLAEGLHDYPCDVYLVPSGKDILTSDLGSSYFYPLPKFNFLCDLREGVKLECNIRPVDDPSQIDLGGIYLDVTSADILHHLNQCIAFIDKDHPSKLTAAYKRIISHGIFPVYPPPRDVAVDYAVLAPYIRLDRLGPHIIALPTRFQQSVNNVEDRLVVTVQKCWWKRRVLLIEIPQIESSNEAPTKSIVITDYTHREISLDTPSASSQTKEAIEAPESSAVEEEIK